MMERLHGSSWSVGRPYQWGGGEVTPTQSLTLKARVLHQACGNRAQGGAASASEKAQLPPSTLWNMCMQYPSLPPLAFSTRP